MLGDVGGRFCSRNPSLPTLRPRQFGRHLSGELDALVEDAEQGHRHAMDEVEEVLEELERQCRLVAELQPSGPLAKVSINKSAAVATEPAGRLATQFEALRGAAQPEPPEMAPEVLAFEAHRQRLTCITFYLQLACALKCRSFNKKRSQSRSFDMNY